jgi:DNA-binding transcriptional regulator of glucitol operon
VRRYSFATRPGWLLFHLFTLAAIVTMILLGRWQLHVSEHKHFDIQNFGYSLQWWLFSAFAAFFWWRILRDAARRRAELAAEAAARAAGETQPTPVEAAAEPEPPVAYRRYVMPKVAPASDDPVHTAYNDYLAQLAAKDAKENG